MCVCVCFVAVVAQLPLWSQDMAAEFCRATVGGEEEEEQEQVEQEEEEQQQQKKKHICNFNHKQNELPKAQKLQNGASQMSFPI